MSVVVQLIYTQAPDSYLCSPLLLVRDGRKGDQSCSTNAGLNIQMHKPVRAILTQTTTGSYVVDTSLGMSILLLLRATTVAPLSRARQVLCYSLPGMGGKCPSVPVGEGLEHCCRLGVEG